VITFKQFLEEDSKGNHGEYRNDSSEKAMVHHIIRICMKGGVSDKNYEKAYDFLASEWGGALWDKYYELFHQKDPKFTGPHDVRRLERFTRSAKSAFMNWQNGNKYVGKLKEDIFVKDGEMLAAVNPDSARRPSTPTSITTNRRPLGHQAGLTRGQDVYYAFSYKPNDEEGGSTDLLKSFKGKGPFKLDPNRRTKFIDETTSHMASEFKRMNLKPDMVVAPNSSSSLLSDFASQLAHKLGVKDFKIGAFKKTATLDLPEDKAEALALIEKKHIDQKHVDEKFSGDDEKRAKVIKELCQAIYRSIKKHGGIVAKELPKMYAKFVKNIMDPHELEGLEGKTVMVVDDILSSGSTMSDLFRICNEMGAKKVVGATLFARSGSK